MLSMEVHGMEIFSCMEEQPLQYIFTLACFNDHIWCMIQLNSSVEQLELKYNSNWLVLQIIGRCHYFLMGLWFVEICFRRLKLNGKFRRERPMLFTYVHIWKVYTEASQHSQTLKSISQLQMAKSNSNYCAEKTPDQYYCLLLLGNVLEWGDISTFHHSLCHSQHTSSIVALLEKQKSARGLTYFASIGMVHQKMYSPQKWLHSVVMPGAKLRSTCLK